MNSFTERYLAVALQGIPDRQKADVERELRSSIGDAIDDRVGAGEEPEAAERAVLEQMGEPSQLAASLAGRPLYLIGPELFPTYRALLGLLLVLLVPLIGVVAAIGEIINGGQIGSVIVAGLGGALTVAVHIVFWFTIVFAVMERANFARDPARAAGVGRWRVDDLPKLQPTRISVGKTVEETFPLILGIIGLLIVRGLTWRDPTTGAAIPFVSQELVDFWLPAMIAVLIALIVFRLVLYFVGRWTYPMAIVYAVLELALGVPIVYLAINGLIINPAFAKSIGYPQIVAGDGLAMVLFAFIAAVITAWEVFDGFRLAYLAARDAPRPAE